MRELFYVFFSCLLCADIYAATWMEALEILEVVSWPDVKERLESQYSAFSENKSPSLIGKEIHNIPIYESGEKIVDIAKMGNPRVQMLPTPPRIMGGPDHNAGFLYSGFVRKGVYDALNSMAKYLDELADVGGYRPGSIVIKVFEGLRDTQTQGKLFDKKLKELKLKNPGWSESQVEAEAAKWVSPVKDNIPVHSTGAAVDIRLWNVDTASFLDMGPFGVIWGHNPTAPTFYESITREQKFNRFICIAAAAKAGLVNYLNEYWHFSLGDRYSAFWKRERKALYGPVLIGGTSKGKRERESKGKSAKPSQEKKPGIVIKKKRTILIPIKK